MGFVRCKRTGLIYVKTDHLEKMDSMEDYVYPLNDGVLDISSESLGKLNKGELIDKYEYLRARWPKDRMISEVLKVENEH